MATANSVAGTIDYPDPTDGTGSNSAAVAAD